MSARSNLIAIVGAGAAGLIASIAAAECGARVLLLERNGRPGLKLKITGKGRCNLTNNCQPDEFLQNLNAPRFLHSALSQFSPENTMEFFENLGVPLKTERGRRVFPASEQSDDIVNALVSKAAALGVKFLYGRRIRTLRQLNAEFSPDAVIVAAGGLSYPKTGSTGDGYALAREAGHTITPLSPSLVPLVSPDEFCGELMGLSLKNVTLKLVAQPENKIVFTEGPGEMLFTHFGVSGPLVLSASSHWCKGQSLHIDLKPGLDAETLDRRILRDFTQHKTRNLSNSLGDLLHKRMVDVVIFLAGLDGDKRVAEITKAERRKLGVAIKDFPVNITDTRPIDEAVVTRGGVSLKEINPRTMESKLRKNLYFAGEVLDLDAYTGGYNLQIAWSTGYISGRGAALNE